MRVTVTDLKNQLSRYLRLVKQGETIVVLEHSVPIARLQRIPFGRIDPKEGLGFLIRDGVVTPASKEPARELVQRPPVPCSEDPVRVLIEQRGDR